MLSVPASSPPVPPPETILVVDEDLRAVVRVTREREGHPVLDTGDPQQAIQTA
jgi:hypothetical protein